MNRLMISNSIANFAKEIANSFGLDTWDWLALVIAILSLSIAIISIIVAYKTLKSQIKTENNTQPIMTDKVQYYLLQQKLLSLFDTYTFLFSLHYILHKMDYKAYPSSHFWYYVNMDNNDVNESLFYNDEKKYIAIHSLSQAHKLLKENLLSLRNVVENSYNGKEAILNELTHIYDCIGLLLRSYKGVLKDVYMKTDDQVFVFLNEYFFNAFKTPLYNIYRLKFCKESESLCLPYMSDAESDVFLEQYINNFVELAENALNLSCSMGDNNLKDNLRIHVHTILLNVICQGNNMVFYPTAPQKDTSFLDKNRDYLIEQRDFVDTYSIENRVLPDKPHGFCRWLFYMQCYQ